MDPTDHIIRLFRDRFGKDPERISRAPGRVNLLGEHVDYNDGFVMPIAIDRATYVAFRTVAGESTTLVAADFGEEVTFLPAALSSKTDVSGKTLAGWTLYPCGVAWALQEAGQSIPSLQAIFTSTVPRGAGLSSSASVEMAFAVVWQAAAGGSLPPIELAKLSQRAENHYVGINCGIMDQFAAACGKKDHALRLDCRSLAWEKLPLPPEVVVIVADTMVRNTLVNSAYNRRRAACEEAVQILRNALPEIRALRDVTLQDFNRLAPTLPDEAALRARYVIEEIERTLAAEPLLKRGDLPKFGVLMNECHAGLRDLYEVSCPELDTMVDIAQSLPGCLGARLTGAGFGGCTVNLVDRSAAQEFARELGMQYQEKTGTRPEIYVCHASDGAQVIS